MNEQALATSEAVSSERRVTRRRFRFSLRALLIATTLLAVVLGWLGNEYRVYRQERAAAELLKGKGRIALLCDVGEQTANYEPSINIRYLLRGKLTPRITRVRVSGATLDDSWSPPLQALADLKLLHLIGCRASGNTDPFARLNGLEEVYIEESDLQLCHLRSIGKLPSLQRVSFFGSLPSPNAIHELTAIQSLRGLMLEPTPVSDTALRQIAMRSELKYLVLSGCVFSSDEAAKALAKLDRLQALSLTSTSINDRAFESADFDELRSLEVSGCAVTDRSLKGIVHSFRLFWLDLSNTQITDEGAKDLLKLPWLKYLDLRGTKITAESLGIARELRARGVNVYTDFSDPNPSKSEAEP